MNNTGTGTGTGTGKRGNYSWQVSSPGEKKAKMTLSQRRPAIFCDLDGVLVDFIAGIQKLSGGKKPDEMSIGRIWATVAKKQTFFESLDWTPDGKELWEAIRHLQPTILTGVPSNKPDVVGEQKASWCQREFQCLIQHVDKAATKPQQHAVVSTTGKKRKDAITVVSCWSKFKHLECKVPGSILIDDRLKLLKTWESAGGIFVHHTDTQSSLQRLKELGVIITSKDSRDSTPASRPVANYLEDERPDTP
jgi:hypothetical protein